MQLTEVYRYSTLQDARNLHCQIRRPLYEYAQSLRCICKNSTFGKTFHTLVNYQTINTDTLRLTNLHLVVSKPLDGVYQSVTSLVYNDFESVGLPQLNELRFHPKLTWQEAYKIAQERQKKRPKEISLSFARS